MVDAYHAARWQPSELNFISTKAFVVLCNTVGDTNLYHIPLVVPTVRPCGGLSLSLSLSKDLP